MGDSELLKAIPPSPRHHADDAAGTRLACYGNPAQAGILKAHCGLFWGANTAQVTPHPPPIPLLVTLAKPRLANWEVCALCDPRPLFKTPGCHEARLEPLPALPDLVI